jgi:ParB-like nuclease domain
LIFGLREIALFLGMSERRARYLLALGRLAVRQSRQSILGREPGRIAEMLQLDLERGGRTMKRDNPEKHEVDLITIPPRMRKLNEAAVVSLMESIQKVGLISPILLRNIDERTDVVLIAGAHRLEPIGEGPAHGAP